MKKIGILIDTYKLSYFLEKFKSNGLCCTSKNYNKDLTLIQMMCTENIVSEVYKLCSECEEYFDKKKSQQN